MYIITAATGKIGKALAFALLAEGKKVRVIGRDAGKLKELTDKGAEAMVGDVKDADFVMKAFAGGTAAFCLIPPSYHAKDFRAEQRQVGQNYANAVKANGIKYALLLSSVGAHLRNGAGVVDGLGDMEEAFLALNDVNVINLRPTYFMENLFGQIGTIKAMGVIGSPVKADIPLSMVATKDIAVKAFEFLKDPSFHGNSIHYVLGPRDVTYTEVATILGNAIGKPDLKYVEFPYEDAKSAMVMSGFVSENVAELYNGLARAMNDGSARNAHTRTPENTTPTTLEEFAKGFAVAYNA